MRGPTKNANRKIKQIKKKKVREKNVPTERKKFDCFFFAFCGATYGKSVHFTYSRRNLHSKRQIYNHTNT